MADQLVQLEPGRKVERWTIEKKLGEGAFGAVYRVNDKTGIYALKVEGANEAIQLLKMEVFVLNELSKSGGRHFCKIEDKGRMDNFNYVVMTFVGKSLQDLRLDAPGKKFSPGTALSVGIQCLEALEDLHGIGYLHRDVKPANYTIGRAELNEVRKVYVLDFGMARKFVHDDGTIKKPRTVAGFRGTVKYAPVACHAQREQCRLDDLETWLYMQVEFSKGSLPWRNLKDMNEIGRMKRSCRCDLPMKQLFGGCPREYIDVMRTIDGGKFFEEPNYRRIYDLLRGAMRNLGVQEFPYDWERWEEEKKKREEFEKKRKEEEEKKKAEGEKNDKAKEKDKELAKTAAANDKDKDEKKEKKKDQETAKEKKDKEKDEKKDKKKDKDIVSEEKEKTEDKK